MRYSSHGIASEDKKKRTNIYQNGTLKRSGKNLTELKPKKVNFKGIDQMNIF
jgi:hypothetical protein